MPERPLASGDLGKRDATYAPTDDLPEAGVPEPPQEAPSPETATFTVAQPAPSDVPAQAAVSPNTALLVARALSLPLEQNGK
jgi:hypothetical protein